MDIKSAQVVTIKNIMNKRQREHIAGEARRQGRSYVEVDQELFDILDSCTAIVVVKE